jgi:hypothetical protein
MFGYYVIFAKEDKKEARQCYEGFKSYNFLGGDEPMEMDFVNVE